MSRSASTWTVTVATAVLLTLGVVAVQSQAPTPTFRVQVESVEVSARVSDAQGRFVRGLTADDFEVLEDGRPQAITSVRLVDLPFEPATQRSVMTTPKNDTPEPDVSTNARVFDGRLYILLLDEQHVLPAASELVRRAARRFIDDHLAPGDQMAVVGVGASDKYSQQFTDNKARLRAAVNGFQGSADPLAAVAKYEQYSMSSRESVRASGVFDPYASSRSKALAATISRLIEVAEWFGNNVRGRRKSLLFVSEGLDIPAEALEEVVRAASRADVRIDAIDPRGLTDLATDAAVELNGLKQGDDPNSPVFRGITSQGLRDTQRRQMTSLRFLADRTDGQALTNSNGFAGFFDRVVEENSAYYVLAYSPPNPKRDGRFHKVTVRVKRPGLDVRARSGYTAPRKAPGPPAPDFEKSLSLAAREALDNPLQTSTLRLQVFAAPFKGTGAAASVLVGAELRGQDLRFGPDGRVRVAYIAADVSSVVRGTKVETLTLNLDAETQRRAQDGVARAMTRLDLPPGRYQIRVIADRIEPSGAGSVYYDLDVPDFSKGALSMSGVVLTSMAASHAPTVRADDALAAVLPAPPVGARRFPAGESLALYAEIYDNVASPHDVEIATRITSPTGVVFAEQESRRSSSLDAGRMVRYLKTLNLGGLPAGSYVLSVEAQDPARSGSAVSRRVPFEIEAGP